MGATTRAADVIDALIVLVREATGLVVSDGPTLGELPPETVVVGLGEAEAGATFTTSQEPRLGRPLMREDFEVPALLYVGSGNTDPAPLRRRAQDLLGAIDSALRDGGRTGLWERALVEGATKWASLQTPDGAQLAVTFTVVGFGFLP